MLVEDVSADVALTRLALRRANLSPRLETADDGELAVQYLEGAGIYADRDRYPWPALLLLDLTLPRRNGFDVLDWIGKHVATGSLPVVVLSSSSEREDIDRAYASGANSYVRKPDKLDGLIDVLGHLIPYWLNINLSNSST